jgi:hypothetical protein
VNRYNINLAATQRLGEYEDTGITPEQIYDLNDMYRKKCEEVNKLKRMLVKAQEFEVEKCSVSEYLQKAAEK